MPSFDIVSEVDPQEIDNAINQARKELATRFDFKGSTAEIIAEKDKVTLTAEDASRLKGLREIVLGKLGKRGVDLRNIDQVEPAISPLGHARQELKIKVRHTDQCAATLSRSARVLFAQRSQLK